MVFEYLHASALKLPMPSDTTHHTNFVTPLNPTSDTNFTGPSDAAHYYSSFQVYDNSSAGTTGDFCEHRYGSVVEVRTFKRPNTHIRLMAVDRRARILALPPPVVAEQSAPALTDMREYFDPDGVWVLGPDRVPSAYARARTAFATPVVHPPLGNTDSPIQHHSIGPIDVLTVQQGRALEQVLAFIEEMTTALGRQVILVCDDVAVSVDRTQLTATLDWAADLARVHAALSTDLVVLTGQLPADYDHEWVVYRDGTTVAEHDRRDAASTHETVSDTSYLRIHGMGGIEGHGSTIEIACLSLSPDGMIGVEHVDATSFGLESIRHIGSKTATRLANQGITTRAAVQATSTRELEQVPNIGATRARQIKQHATVLTTGTPLRVTNKRVPGETYPAPLCLDIETDGLSPTIIWQIGVYDPLTDTHQSFTETTNPTDPTPVLEAFLDWLFGLHANRALLTWNGYRFDYRHLTTFINRYVDHYAKAWDDLITYDLYHWAVHKENALLPGRTNKLDQVAHALGYDGINTGLDGATTAAAYQRFIHDGTALEWDRHEAYCEDDCRALWYVYEALVDADHNPSAVHGSRHESQTGLSDF